MMADARVTTRMLEQALTYLTRMAGGDAERMEQARRALERWVARDPRHGLALQQAERLCAHDPQVAAALQTYLPRPAAASPGRRDTLRRLAGAGLALGLLGLLRLPLSLGPATGALRTGHAETDTLVLPDGTVLELDALTRVALVYSGERRQLFLSEGRLHLGVAADPGRPFVVQTPWGRVQVLGTEFSVTARARQMRVEVDRGQVEVWGRKDAGGSVRLGRGQAVASGEAGLGPVYAVETSAWEAWRQGWLVFDATPLAEAVADWSPWLRQPVRLAESASSPSLRITGSFPRNRPGLFLDALAAALPVQVQTGPDGAILISAQK